MVVEEADPQRAASRAAGTFAGSRDLGGSARGEISGADTSRDRRPALLSTHYFCIADWRSQRPRRAEVGVVATIAGGGNLGHA
jgi:hypothetical protein